MIQTQEFRIMGTTSYFQGKPIIEELCFLATKSGFKAKKWLKVWQDKHPQQDIFMEKQIFVDGCLEDIECIK